MTEQPRLEVGLAARVGHRVRSDDTAIVFGSGEVPVLATPRALAWCEEATVHATIGHLEPGVTTVGLRVNLDHVRPALVGTKVFAEAVIEKVDGRRVTFGVKLEDETGELLATGRVVRVVLTLDRFMARLESAAANPAADDTGQVPVTRPGDQPAE